ncbi:hypothetical protein ES708_04659 [subsurface metagenome]
MATIKRGINREQESHFGLYRTSAGGDQGIIVRRKVGEPSDYMHKNSRSLARQREIFSMASRHYANLTPGQKGESRHQFAEVEYQKSHGKTDIKLLTGRELYIAQDVRSLRATQKQTVFPYELCIMLVDQNLNPLEGELWLYCTVTGEWFDLPKVQISKGHWLFSKVPPGYPPYRVYGETGAFFDPELPEHQYMTEDYMLSHHYHILVPTWPYRSYSISAGWWYHSSRRTAYEPYTAMHIRSEIYTYNFEGELTINLKELIDGDPPYWQTYSRTYLVTPVDPDPKLFSSTHAGLDIEVWENFYIEHFLTGNGSNYWKAIIRYYQL